jgi:hypothetical protein
MSPSMDSPPMSPMSGVHYSNGGGGGGGAAKGGDERGLDNGNSIPGAFEMHLPGAAVPGKTPPSNLQYDLQYAGGGGAGFDELPV